MKTAAIAAALAAAMTASLVGATDASAMVKIRIYSDLQIPVKSADYAPALSRVRLLRGARATSSSTHTATSVYEPGANAEGRAVFHTIQCTSDKVAR